MCYFLCRSLLASPFWSDFHPIPALYTDTPDFYSGIFPPSDAMGCHARGAKMRFGRAGSHGWQIIGHGFA